MLQVTEQPLNNTSGPFTYTWIVKNFQDLYNQKCLEYYYSDPFISHSTSEKVSMDEDSTTTIDKIEHKWRLLLYPHGHRSKKVKTHISLYLSAIQSKFEKENNIKTRTSKWRFEILRINNEIENPKITRKLSNPTVTTNGLSRLNGYRNMLEKQFIFNNEKEPTWGSVKFCEFETIFPNNLDSKFNLIRMDKVDIVIRVHFFDESYTATNYDLEMLNIDILLRFGPRLDEYFDNERFSDVIFKFDCGSQLYVSRLVLASRSIYFKTMFNGEWLESKSLNIHIKDVDHKIFRIIIYFLYTGILEDGLTFDTLVNVYAEADMREIDELAKLIILRVVEMVDKDNWDDVLLLGWATDNYWLKDQALMYIHSRWEELKDTERMKK
ncbi:8300_t:CDS:2 [Cetraspora pellucida]|uniref:8300_t:CDS:1 n=1 Tax=Cetraspora pellucida TaxID=1433469 RepID=A0A9N9A9C6_9GLOM|nr:8300_t:CDS:2 [Cetraspora pellucida]